MDQRTRRSPARFLAPLALIAVLVAFLAIVSGSGGGSSSSSSTAGTTTTTSSSHTTTASKTSTTKSKTHGTITGASGSGPKTYTVKVGDTLGSIAASTGVPLSKIQELNPDVDPHAMVAGQQIKLR
jgi:LysM repeat protein